ncbi:MAG: hypothetical protein Q8K86_08890 [Candidatus Nanopelagicaceae bacterium]|nr:hypothetical protein [Candidatus Nanopelagicaceae bacterium]
MFFKIKTVLVTSKRDRDATEFLSRNVKFTYDNLPQWLQELFPLKNDNQHSLEFDRTGSKIMSLPAGKDTMRSYTSSLNIIDEAAFTPHMGEMWAGGQPSLMHSGGRVIVISTPGNVGDWYWNTYTDAKSGDNDFFPIEVEWQDMDWEIEFKDEASNRRIRIAPRDGIRPTTPEEKSRYGAWWSPWLEQQYRDLQQRGEVYKFAREFLGRFESSGSTVVPYEKLKAVEAQVGEQVQKKTASVVDFVHPISEERIHLDFNDDLWIWKEPIVDVLGRRNIVGQTVAPTKLGHRYVIGVDSATGEADDLVGLQVFDATTMEQVAEYTGFNDATVAAHMADYLGRWYNNAIMVVERIGYGMAVLQDLRDYLHYPNLWRKITGPYQLSDYGYKTTSTSKPLLNKLIIDWCGDHLIRSTRLYKQLTTYVNLRKNAFGNQPGIGNHDDLVMAMGLALVGLESTAYEPASIYRPNQIPELKTQVDLCSGAAYGLMLPRIESGGGPDELSEVERFSRQLASSARRVDVPAVIQKPKYTL